VLYACFIALLVVVRRVLRAVNLEDGDDLRRGRNLEGPRRPMSPDFLPRQAGRSSPQWRDTASTVFGRAGATSSCATPMNAA